MKSSRIINTFLAGLLFSSVIQAAEVQVLPGSGTLAQAVTNASDGDTLVLSDGSYVANGELVIDKALTIRATNSSVTSLINGTSFTVDAAGSQVILQGLDFALEVSLVAAADIKVLESKFFSGYDLNVTEYKSTEGDGTLTVIGNFFTPGSLITTINAFDAYIAGNTFEKGHLISNVPVWIIGNLIKGTANVDAININTEGAVRVLANRVFMYTSSIHNIDGIDIIAGSALIAGNIVKINIIGGTGNGYTHRGIIASNTTFSKVFNNVVDAGDKGAWVSGSSYGILAYGEVSGNMVINHIHYLHPIAGTGAENNLCHANHHSECGTNPVTADPQLVDRIDYRLSATSPAIDAGSTSPVLADLDRTRNDIGAYGGSWSIGQYDAQRDPLYFGPFVYPLFEANGSFVDGQLQVRAIGVARLR